MIAIIGAGISGLTLAWELQKKNIDYVLIESTDKPGGVIDSARLKGYLLEKGPATLMADESIINFLYEIGLQDDIILPLPEGKNRFIYKKGKYRKVPSSPFSFFFGNFFSFQTKIDVIKELYSQSKNVDKNETLSEFFERRFNQEITDYVLDPLVSGIFAGNTKELLVKKTFPFLHKLEEQYGSVLKGFIKSKSSTSRKESISFKKGMKSLPLAIAEKLVSIRYNTKVNSINKEYNNFSVEVSDKNGDYSIKADKIVIASPAWATASMVKDLYPSFANALEKIQYAPIVKFFSAFNRQNVGHPLNGYGGLNPSCEKQFILGSMWNSSVYPDVCSQGEVLLTSMVGGSIYAKNTLLGDGVIKNNVIKDLKTYYQIKSNPTFEYLYRIPKAIPQFDMNVLPVDTYVKELEKEEFYICASWKDGAAIGDCIKKGIKLAESLKKKQLVV